MDTVSIFGWIAAGFVLSSFYLRTMVPLRLAAIASNVMFIIYAILANAPPILVLHCLLFPLNVWRLLEIRNLRRKLVKTSLEEISPALLLPFMQKSRSEQGCTIFHKGDSSDKVYFILRGEVWLQDSGKSLAEGHLLGLVGIFSNEKRCTDSALCLTDVEYGVITADTFRELVYQDPMAANYVIRSMVHSQLIPAQKSSSTQIENSTARSPHGMLEQS